VNGLGVTFACSRCEFRGGLDAWFRGCPDCRRRGQISVLEAAYPVDVWPREGPFGPRRDGFWGYAPRLPVPDAASRITLGEGNTPLVRSRRIGPSLGLPELLFKWEGANPTFSFKDRYAAVTMSVAKSLGYKKVVVSSTGNYGAAVAAYAAVAGLTCVVLCADGVPGLVLEQIVHYGGQPVVIEGPDRFTLVEYLVEEHGWFPAALFLETRVHNPFGVEGYKTIAWEIVRDLGDAPDAVVFPCARGNGLYGTWKGFRELRDLGIIQRLPSMIACQPAGAATISASLRAGMPVRLTPGPSVAASVNEEFASARAVDAVRESGGTAVGVPDAAAVEAARALGGEGLWAEVSSAVALAGVEQLVGAGDLVEDMQVVVVLTGSGARWARAASAIVHSVPRIRGTSAELEACLALLDITP
jgi:threonine synthase